MMSQESKTAENENEDRLERVCVMNGWLKTRMVRILATMGTVRYKYSKRVFTFLCYGDERRLIRTYARDKLDIRVASGLDGGVIAEVDNEQELLRYLGISESCLLTVRLAVQTFPSIQLYRFWMYDSYPNVYFHTEPERNLPEEVAAASSSVPTRIEDLNRLPGPANEQRLVSLSKGSIEKLPPETELDNWIIRAFLEANAGPEYSLED